MRIIPSHGVCGHTDKRMFRLRSALRVLMHRRRVSGRFVQLVAGHLSFGAIASRGALSFSDSVYKYAAKHWMSRGISWDSLTCTGLLSLFKRDWTNCWCPEVYCSDASKKKKKGWSLATRMAPVSLVASNARVLERSRFRAPAGRERAHEHVFQHLGLADPAPEDEFLEVECEEIPDIPCNLCRAALRRRLASCRLWWFRLGREHFATRNAVRASEQCNLLVKDIGMCVYFSCSTEWHWFFC